MSACATPPGLTPLPDPPTDDDDDLAPGPLAETATFAAVLLGEVDDSSAPSTITTKSEGVFQFLYWDDTDSGAPLCRQRIPFRAEARFGPLTAAGCGGCTGTFTVTDLLPEPPSALAGQDDDACDDEVMAPADLSFLLTGVPSAQGENPDFAHFALVTVEELLAADWQLSPSGVQVAGLVDTYAAAGLTATHLAMVRPGGWLDDVADLSSIVSPWGVQGWLPMFLVYRDADRPLDADWMPGEVFMTSLWQVAIQEPRLPVLPPSDGMSVD